MPVVWFCALALMASRVMMARVRSLFFIADRYLYAVAWFGFCDFKKIGGEKDDILIEKIDLITELLKVDTNREKIKGFKGGRKKPSTNWKLVTIVSWIMLAAVLYLAHTGGIT